MFSVAEIAKIVGGRLLRGNGGSLLGQAPPRLVHDSRSVREGDLFIALKGERTDGHVFLEEVFSCGARGAIISDAKAMPRAGRNLIVVEDTLQALHTLATAWREELGATFVGITGSCGKTTTKALLAHLLADDMEVFVAPASYNTEIGLPLALLAMPTSAQVGVFELGASGPGEIAPLAALLSPQIALLSMVGRAHLAGFGSVEVVVKEKWELVCSLPPDGTVIVNNDSPELVGLARTWRGELLTFGLEGGMLHGRITGTLPGLCVEVDKPQLRLSSSLIGRHNAANLLGAVACALHLGVPPEAIEQRVTTFDPPLHRLTLLPTAFGYLLDDTYNANPDSTRAALRALVELKLPVNRRSFVFGDMLELGEESARFHHDALELALQLGIAPIFPVGELANQAAQGVLEGVPPGTILFSTREELEERIRKNLQGDQNLLLVKGSRRLGLEGLVERLSGQLSRG